MLKKGRKCIIINLIIKRWPILMRRLSCCHSLWKLKSGTGVIFGVFRLEFVSCNHPQSVAASIVFRSRLQRVGLYRSWGSWPQRQQKIENKVQPHVATVVMIISLLSASIEVSSVYSWVHGPTSLEGWKWFCYIIWLRRSKCNTCHGVIDMWH